MEPNNSLEALDNLVHCKSETKCKECKHKNVCTLERDYNIVKQDLIQKEQDIQDVIADYQDAARKMFKYVEAIDEILDYLKSHDVSIDFLSDIENIVARAGYYE
jgi:hypothetical protein